MADIIHTAEEWRTVDAHPNYSVSNLGRVRREPGHGCINGRMLKPDVDEAGYNAYRLSRGGVKTKQFAHRLVAFAFIGPCPGPGYQVAHYDDNGSNNCVGNLRWATSRENNADKIRHGTHQAGEKHGMAKLTDDLVKQIRVDSRSGAAIARELGMEKGTINRVLRGVLWKHVV